MSWKLFAAQALFFIVGCVSQDSGEVAIPEGAYDWSVDTLVIHRVEDAFSDWSEAEGISSPPHLTAHGADHGSVYVFDHREMKVRVLRTSGEEIASFGNEGGGPGEFRRPGRIQVDEEILWVYDPGKSELTWWDPQGRFLGVRSLPNPERAEGSFGVLRGEVVVVPTPMGDSVLFSGTVLQDSPLDLPALRREVEGPRLPLSVDRLGAGGDLLVGVENATGRLYWLTPGDESAATAHLPTSIREGIDERLGELRQGGPPDEIPTQYVNDVQVLDESRVLLAFYHALPGPIVGAMVDLDGKSFTALQLAGVPLHNHSEMQPVRVPAVTAVGRCFLVSVPLGVERYCPA